MDISHYNLEIQPQKNYISHSKTFSPHYY